jgi:Putative esterase
VPVAGQLLNYGPDSLMLSGGSGAIPMTGEGDGTSFSAPPMSSPGPSAGPAATKGPSPAHAPAGLPPWLAWRPSGAGTVVERTLPAPWTGGASTVVSFAIYLPPGYQAGTRRYPVVYELPWPIVLYDNGADIRATLDGFMDGGQLPASIVVFVSSGGGPFVDNECIDAAGGREGFDTFVGTTLVRYLDANFRTIPTPAARTLMGDSQGGFCGANVLLHHPDVFHQEISFSGYYVAAPLLGMTPSARAPYAGDRALELANSPALIDGRLAPALRRQLLFTLIANPVSPFYGTQYLQFGGQARALGYLVAQIPTQYGHSWLAVRVTIGPALRAVADREVTEGVFAAS